MDVPSSSIARTVCVMWRLACALGTGWHIWKACNVRRRSELFTIGVPMSWLNCMMFCHLGVSAFKCQVVEALLGEWPSTRTRSQLWLPAPSSSMWTRRSSWQQRTGVARHGWVSSVGVQDLLTIQGFDLDKMKYKSAANLQFFYQQVNRIAGLGHVDVSEDG